MRTGSSASDEGPVATGQPSGGEKQSTRRSPRGASVNRSILTGRLVAAPELQTTGSGIQVTTVRIVTNDREQPEFNDVVLWRQMADFATTTS